MPEQADDFRFAGAYLELNIRDNTEADEKQIRDRYEHGAPVRIPTTLGAPTNDPLSERRIPPVQIPTTASDPIDDAWRARVQASLRDTTRTALDVPLTSDTAPYRDELKLKLGAIRDELKQDIPADLADADAYKLKVEALVREVSDSLAVKLKVQLDPESEARIAAEIQALEDLANRSSGSGSGGGPPGSSGGGSASPPSGGGSGGGGGGMGGVIAMGAALGAGPIAGASLLTIPAVFTAIGVAAEHSSPQVVQSFNDMTAAGKQAVQQGFTPFIPALTGLAGEAKSAVSVMEGSFYQASSAVAPLLQLVGHDFIAATQEGVGASVPIIQSMQPVAQALGDDMGKLEQGVTGFFKNLDVGSAAGGLAAVGNVVKDDLPALGTLVSDIAPLGNAILNVLAPAASTAVNELGFIKPVAEGAGAALSFLSPVISGLSGPVVILEAGTKLLTGSWTDWGGAAGKLTSIVKDANGEFDKGASTLKVLAGAVGINTASMKASAIQTAEDAATKATLRAEVAKLAVAEAEDAVATDASAKNKLALIAAQEAEAEAAAAAAAAEKDLAEAEDIATFSMGPLGIVLGVVAGALALVGLNSSKATPPTQDLTSQLLQLGQAAPGAAAGILASDPALTGLVNKATDAGVSVGGLIAAYNGGPQALQTFSDALGKQHQALSDQTVVVDGNTEGMLTAGQVTDATSMTIKDLAAQVGGNKTAYDNLDPSVRSLVVQYNAQNDIQGQLGTSITTLTEQQHAQQAVVGQSAQQTKLSADQQQQATGIATALGISIDSVTTAFRAYAGGVTFGMSATQKLADQFLSQTLAVDTANASVGNYFKTADAAVVSASQSLADAQHSAVQGADAVAQAQHSLAQSAQAVVAARQGVVTAERGVADALANVVVAQNNVTKADVAEQQAQVNLTTARQQAIETLKSLHLQLADQVTTEESARVALFDQQRQSAAIGVTAANAAGIAAQDVTAANEGQVNSAIALLKAQQSLADALNSGANLRDQVTAADKAGVDGAPGVISAQQAIASAQDQVTAADQALVKAHQAVADAQANVLKAEQGVTDALYNEAQARKAVADALYNEGKQAQAVAAARQALQTAQDNDSHSMDINTAAGQRNFAMLQQIAQQLAANEDPQQAGNDLIKDTANLFGISTTAAQAYLTNLGKIPANFQFGLTAVAAADFSQLNNAYATILARGANATAGLPVAHGTGGPIEGVGGPTEDNILIRASAREFMQPVSSVDYYGTPFMEAIRARKIPKDAIRGFATGGTVGDLSNALGMGALGDLYQVAADTFGVLGVPSPPAPKSLPVYVPPPPPTSGGGNAAPAQGGSAAQAQAYAQSIMGRYGWGPEQWIPWLKLGNEESGWNANAINASSGAYGIGQSLGHGHPYNLGDYVAQVNWMADYIKGRYGNPAAAWAFETSHTPNWYDWGGYAKPGDTLVRNATALPEMMLPPGMTKTMEALNAAVHDTTAGAATSSAPSVVHHHYGVNVYAPNPETAHATAARVNANMSWQMMHAVGG